jgi:hypothetical protein
MVTTAGYGTNGRQQEHPPFMLEQFRITDFLDWDSKKTLELNPDFQRGDVWKPAAKTFLIDTILRNLPIPKVYLRTRVDVGTKVSVREVVDGQQRLRAIIGFAGDKFTLSKRAGEEFVGKKYSTLPIEYQQRFLEYPIAVDQLFNASTEDVLEVFARLNSYTVTLNGPERRHSKWQGDFKAAIRSASRRWAPLWTTYKVLSTAQRVRMLDDALTAEMVGVVLDGISDGGDAKLNALYKKYDLNYETSSITTLDTVLAAIMKDFAPYIAGTALVNPPHLLMLFAALAHVLVGIPDGEMKPVPMPARGTIRNLDTARENLLNLAAIIASPEEAPAPYTDFWRASKSTTHRIASRRIRFPVYVDALTK